MSFLQSIKAIFSALRLLFKSRRALAVIVFAYAGLIGAIYLFVSTREATIFQLILTAFVALLAPALFFLLQAVSVSYANDPTPGVKAMKDCLKLLVVSVPVLALTFTALYGLNKIHTAVTAITAVRYLLAAVVAPLLVIQLWVVTSDGGLRSALKSVRRVVVKTLAPQSMFVYAIGFLFFAVAPYVMLSKTISIERAWLEWSFLIARLLLSALLILLGWVTTVGALSIMSRSSYATVSKE